MEYEIKSHIICEFHEHEMRDKLIELGDMIHDDLTGKSCKVIRIFHDDFGHIGFEIDSDYCAGLRHPWEIS